MSTLGTMTTNVSRKLGDTTDGQYYTVANIKRAIGDSYRFYVQRMAKLGEGYFETTTDLNLTADTETISLASLTPPFWFCSQLWRYVTNGQQPLERDEGRNEMNITTGAGTGDSYLPKYNFRGTNLVLKPRPGVSETTALKLDYVYIPTFPSSSSLDAFDFSTGTSGITDTGFPVIYEANVELRALIKLMHEKEVTGAIVDWKTHKEDLAEMDEEMMDTLMRDEGVEYIEPNGVDYSSL